MIIYHTTRRTLRARYVEKISDLSLIRSWFVEKMVKTILKRARHYRFLKPTRRRKPRVPKFAHSFPHLYRQAGFLPVEFLHMLGQIRLALATLPLTAQHLFPHKKIERFVLALSNLFLARNKKQILAASLMCLSTMCEGPLLDILHDAFQKVQKELVRVCEPTLRQQSGLRTLIENWEKMSDSVILGKLREFISFCMTFGTFEHFGVSKDVAEVVYGEFRATKKPKSITSFTFAVLDVVEFTFSRLSCCIESKSLGPLLHCSDSYLEWFDNCTKIQTWQKCIGHDPEVREFSDQEFQHLCEQIIAKGDEYVKIAKTHKARREVSSILATMKVIYGDFKTLQIIGRPRMAPCVILYAGDPAIGKSTIYHIFGRAFGEWFNLPLGHEHIYVRQVFQEFMDGYKTHMWHIVQDDAANVRADRTQGVDPSLGETFIYINTVPATAQMAALEEKGKIAIRPELYSITTNVPDLNLGKYFECPAAAARRYEWRFTPFVKPEFRKGYDPEHPEREYPNELWIHSDDIDPNTCPDYWYFMIEVAKAQPRTDPAGNKIGQPCYVFQLPTEEQSYPPKPEFFSLYGAMLWLREAATRKRSNQKKVTEQMSNLVNVKFCSHGYPPNVCRQCNPPSSVEEIEDEDEPEDKCFWECEGECDHGHEHEHEEEETEALPQLPKNEIVLKQQGYHFALCPWECYPTICPHTPEICDYCENEWCPENIDVSDDERYTENCDGCEYCYDGMCCIVCYRRDRLRQQSLFVPFVSGAFFTFFFIQKEKLLAALNSYLVQLFTLFMRQVIKQYYNRLLTNMQVAQNRVVDTVLDQVEEPTTQISRSRLREIGEEVSSYLSVRTPIIAAFSAFAASIAIYKSYKSAEIDLDEQLDYNPPEPFNEKAPANWAPLHAEIRMSSFLPQSRSAKAWGSDKFKERIGNSTAHVEFTTSKGIYFCNVLFIGGQTAMINSHILDQLPDYCQAKFRFGNGLTHLSKNSTVVFDKVELGRHGDMCLIHLPQFGNWYDLSTLFPAEPLDIIMNGFSLYRSADGQLHEIPLVKIQQGLVCKDKVYVGTIPKDFEFEESYHVGEDRENTKDGHCGAPLIHIGERGCVILGQHQYGGKDRLAAATIVTHSMLANSHVVSVGNLDLGELRPDLELQGGKKSSPEEKPLLQKPIGLTPKLRSKDPLLFREPGLGEVYGSLETGTVRSKTRVSRTPMAPFWESKGHSTEFVPPIFSARSYHFALDDLTDPNMLISFKEAKEISTYIVDHYLQNLPEGEQKLFELYDNETVINGVAGILGVSKMNFKSSMGYPIQKPKKDYFKQTPTGDYEPPPGFTDEVDRIILLAENKIRSNPIFCDCQKDEPRKASKVLEGNIRIFTSCPTPFVAAVRRIFGSLIRIVQRNPFAFDCAFGINAHSKEWHKLAKRMLKKTKFFDGDHKKFDKRMLCFIVQLAIESFGRLMIICMIKHGKLKDPEDIEKLSNIIHTIAIDTAFAFHNFNGTLIQFFRGHSSGETLTTLVNNFVNMLYLCMAFRRVYPGKPFSEFFEHIVVTTYGDDFIVGVNDECIQFNFLTVQSAMRTFGVEITPATKDKEGKAFCLFTDLEFLKRKFVWCHELQRWTGPLDQASISKSLLIGLYEGNIPREQQCVEIMRSALFEMFFHGKDLFDQFRKQIIECVSTLHFEEYFNISTFPTYPELLEKYRDCSYVDIFSTAKFTPEFLALDLQGWLN